MRTPEISLTNMLVEKDPTNLVTGTVLYQRPALTRWALIGPGPIRGIFRKLGVIGGQYFIVSGTTLYKCTESGAATSVGTILGGDIVSMDGSADRLIVVAEGVAYSTDGTTVTTIVVPDINAVPSPISAVVYINGYFILTVKDSQHFFWLAPGDVNPDALNFASAENAPDNIVAPVRVFDELWFLGQQTAEVWQLTGNVDAPFTPIIGRLYEKGCANRDSVAVLDNTIFWVGNDFIVYRADTSPVRISNHSEEERLRVAGSVDLRAWAFVFDGHTIYVVRAANSITLAKDVENPGWSRFKTYEQETWRAHLGVQVAGDRVIAGDDTEGILWELDPTVSNDNGVVMERLFTGGIAVVGKPIKCRSVKLVPAVGWTEDLNGDAANPKIQMRFSVDGGALFTSWFEERLGEQGKYKTSVAWDQLGVIPAPGAVFEWRMTDDAILRVHYATMNDTVKTAA